MTANELKRYKGKQVTVMLYNTVSFTGILEVDGIWWKVGKAGWYHYADIWEVRLNEQDIA